MLYIVFYGLLSLNLLTFILFGIDKHKARNNRWRISEKTLLLLAAFGGSIGAIFGMMLFHHKTLHKKFYLGIPLILLIQIVLVVFFIDKFGMSKLLYF
ncbi:MAG: DUF1294 domain-containing protein [Bacteroidales bacterium]|nr:DUF1294 domain-containing protein [Bacteroidales bacterium]